VVGQGQAWRVCIGIVHRTQCILGLQVLKLFAGGLQGLYGFVLGKQRILVLQLGGGAQAAS
jgi:hypothetical protein